MIASTPRLWAAWTVRVDAVELMARLSTIDATATQIAELKACHESDTLIRRLPIELVTNIAGMLKTMVYMEQKACWTDCIRCISNCAINRHLDASERATRDTIRKADRLRRRHAYLNSIKFDNLTTATHVFAQLSESRHQAVMKTSCDSVRTHGSLAKSQNFLANFGVRPLFLTREHPAFLPVQSDRKYGWQQSARPLWAYLAIPTFMPPDDVYHNDFDTFFDGDACYIVDRKNTTSTRDITEAIAKFQIAIKALELVPLPDHRQVIDIDALDQGSSAGDANPRTSNGVASKSNHSEIHPVLRGIGALTESGWASIGRYKEKTIVNTADSLARHGYFEEQGRYYAQNARDAEILAG